ncbi:MAG: hypothetical protein GX640_14555 [Fibrobacter sp.]|nr:hypothetical protein [Fibrobacter sp.]
MEKELVKESVERDCNSLKDYKKEILQCLLEPSLGNFEDMSGTEVKLWIIGRKEEYLITLNPENAKYGVGFKNIYNEYIYLGDNDSLSDAYEIIISREE